MASMETVIRIATWFGLWFAFGSAFLLLWAGLSYVARRAMRWAEVEVEEARRRESQLDLAWCPRCGRSGGSHTVACLAESRAALQRLRHDYPGKVWNHSGPGA